MVIAYQVSPLSYWVGRAMIRVKWIGLVNIVAGRSLVPELIQKEARGERIAEETLKILEDEPYRRGMMEGIAEVKEKLGSPGAAERVARMALEMIKK
jgi:lipid-A-disaccharide synthase